MLKDPTLAKVTDVPNINAVFDTLKNSAYMVGFNGGDASVSLSRANITDREQTDTTSGHDDGDAEALFELDTKPVVIQLKHVGSVARVSRILTVLVRFRKVVFRLSSRWAPPRSSTRVGIRV